jgi:hypothetical protein
VIAERLHIPPHILATYKVSDVEAAIDYVTSEGAGP